MERKSKEPIGSPNQINPDELSLSMEIADGTDNVENMSNLYNLCLCSSGNQRSNNLIEQEIEVITFDKTSTATAVQNFPAQSSEQHSSHAVSLSMPASPLRLQTEGAKRVMFSNEIFVNGKPSISFDVPPTKSQKKKIEFISQPLSLNNLGRKVTAGNEPSSSNSQQKSFSNNDPRDKRFDSFKTLSGKLERQLSSLRGKPEEPDNDAVNSPGIGGEPLRVHRFFDALKGPELDTLKESEVSALPENEMWPFLLRFPVSSFGICLGISSQAVLWKKLATTSSTRFLHITPLVNLILWFISVMLVVTVSFIYLLKIMFYFEAFRREYYHPIRVNFFFAPWIACLFLALGVPPSIVNNLHGFTWYILMVPIFCLEVKIYGQWMSGGQRRLSKVANPSNHLSIVGNFVGALLGASMGLKEGPMFFFSIGLAHYLVLFVTLYQRLPTNETLPKELHPVFFLFVAAPSVACTAWAEISGSFDYTSRVAYFIAIFLYLSLAVRINFFRGFRFSLAWWAYTFPMTGASIATIAYAAEVNTSVTKILAVALSTISTLAVTILLVTTIFHAFVKQDLFPNDVSIAITETRHNHFWSSSCSDSNISKCAKA